MATEYVAGPTLHDLVRQTGPLPEASVRFLARGVAAALARVHALGTVHRDLKPGNVMVSAAGPQVIDFGVASAMEDAEADEETLVAGTPGYMAPEQIDGDEVTAATDVFALGGVLAYALTGTGPFGDGHPAAVVFRISHQEPVLTGVPEGLRELLAACLSRAPGARPTADRVLAELGGPVVPETEAGAWLPGAAAERVAQIAGRTLGTALGVGAGSRVTDAETAPGPGAVGAADGGALGSAGGADSRTAPDVVARSDSGAVRRAAPDSTGESGGGAVQRRSPGRGRVLAVGAGALALVLTAGLGAWAVVRGEDGAVEETGTDAYQSGGSATGCDLPGDLAPEYVEAARTEIAVPGADTHHLDTYTLPGITLLQDGGLVALSHPEGIALWDAETGDEVAYVGADLPDFAAVPVLSPDGCRFGYPGAEDGVHVFDLRTGAHSRYADELSVPAGVLKFSPDGTHLALAEGPMGNGAHVVDLGTGEGSTVYEGTAHGLGYSPSGEVLVVAGGEAVVAVDTGSGRELYRGEGTASARSKDTVAFPGEDVFYYIGETGVVEVDLVSGEAVEVVADPEDTLSGFVSIAAHSGRLLGVSEVLNHEVGSYLPELTVWDVETGELIAAETGEWYVQDFSLSPDGAVAAVLDVHASSAGLLHARTLELKLGFV